MEDGIPGGLQHRHKMCCKKDGHRGRRACIVRKWFHCGDVIFQTGGLVYDMSTLSSYNNICVIYEEIVYSS